MKAFSCCLKGGQFLILSAAILTCGTKVSAQTADSNTVPVVTVQATQPVATTNNPGVFTVFRAGNTNATLNVWYDLDGTASNGVDYAQISQHLVEIAAGETSNSIVIKPLFDPSPWIPSGKTVVLTLTNSPLMTPVNYEIGSSNQAMVHFAHAVVIPTNLPPAVSLIEPQNGFVYYTPTNIEILAKASDPDGSVTSVEFFAGTNDLGTGMMVVLDPPGVSGVTGLVYLFNWLNPTPGNDLLTAVATDNNDVSTTSAPVNITVQTGPAATNGYITAVLRSACTSSPTPPPPVGGTRVGSDYVIETVADADPMNWTNAQRLVTDAIFESLMPLYCALPKTGCVTDSVQWNIITYDTNGNPRISGGAASGGQLHSCDGFESGPAVIITQPANQSVNSGQTATFSVDVSGAAPLNYQWVFDGTNILDGATNGALVLSDVQTNQAGIYQVVVWNSLGGTNSQPATLTVNPGPAATNGYITAVLRSACTSSPTPPPPVGGTRVGPDYIIETVADADPMNWTNAQRLVTDAVFESLMPLYCALPKTNCVTDSVQWNIITYDTNGNPRISGCAASGCQSHSCEDLESGPPVVRIISPADGTTFFAPINIPLYAYASDPGGSVASVEFFDGTNSLGFGQTMPATTPDHIVVGGPLPPVYPTNLYFLTWSNAPVGAHVLTAEATDNDGASSNSAPVKIAVQPSLPPPTNRPAIVSIVASDPVAIEGTNDWVWPGETNATPTWAAWPAAIGRFFTNCGPKTATFTVRRFGDTNSDLTLPYDIGGTASNGVDYALLPGSVTIPAGERRALITIVPVDDGPPDINKTVILALEPSTNSQPDYMLGFPRRAAAIIIDGDGPRQGTALLPDKCFHFVTTGPDAAWFCIEYSTNMSNWTPVCTNQVINGSIDFIDPDAAGNSSRFYRAVPLTNPPSN